MTILDRIQAIHRPGTPTPRLESNLPSSFRPTSRTFLAHDAVIIVCKHGQHAPNDCTSTQLRPRALYGVHAVEGPLRGLRV